MSKVFINSQPSQSCFNNKALFLISEGFWIYLELFLLLWGAESVPTSDHQQSINVKTLKFFSRKS